MDHKRKILSKKSTEFSKNKRVATGNCAPQARTPVSAEQQQQQDAQETNALNLDVEIFSEEGKLLYQFQATQNTTVGECLVKICSAVETEAVRPNMNAKRQAVGLCKEGDTTPLNPSHTLLNYFLLPRTKARLILLKPDTQLLDDPEMRYMGTWVGSHSMTVNFLVYN